MHYIVGLFLLGFIVIAAITVFQLVIGLVVAVIAFPIAGVSWLIEKLRSIE